MRRTVNTGRKKKESQTATTVLLDESAATLALNEGESFEGLRASLVEINKILGVHGFILRNATNAVIDLQDPGKLFEYAVLSSEAMDACQTISELFSLSLTRTVVEGAKSKMICMVAGENRLSVFTEKSVDHADIFKRILP